MEPLPLSVEMAHEILGDDSPVAEHYDGPQEGSQEGQRIAAALAAIIDARIRPLVEQRDRLAEMLEMARGYVAEYACDNPNDERLVAIDAALRGA